MDNRHSIFPQKITREHCKDTGLAIILILLLLHIFFDIKYTVMPAMVVTLIIMTLPVILKPLAFAWFSLSAVLNAVFSKVILSLIFILMVTPVAFLLKISGKDILVIRQFKKSKKSVFINRDHLIIPGDIKPPY